MRVNAPSASPYSLLTLPPLSMKEDMIMTKSLVAAIAAGVALAVFAGAYAYVNNGPAIQMAKTEQARPPIAKGDAIQDCIRATFPQCGDNELRR
jgi:hypothetical protein